MKFRSEVSEMRQAIRAIENGSVAPVMGMDFAMPP